MPASIPGLPHVSLSHDSALNVVHGNPNPNGCGGAGVPATGLATAAAATAGAELKVAVIGAGPFAQGFCSRAITTGAIFSSMFCLGVRRLLPPPTDDPVEQVIRNHPGVGHLDSLPGVPVKTVDAAIHDADVVVLAVPAAGIPRLVEEYGSRLKGKVVVDVCNPTPADLRGLLFDAAGSPDASAAIDPMDGDTPKDVESVLTVSGLFLGTKVTSVATWLQAALGDATPVVKACNNLSAYGLTHLDPFADPMRTAVATDFPVAGQMVAGLLKSMGMEVTLVPSLEYACKMERQHHSLMTEWQLPLGMMVALWLLVHIYSFIRYNYFGGTGWESVTMWITNKSIGWAALWGMVITYLPGVLVCFAQLTRRRPALRLWRWFKVWMDMRKQLGLLALFGVLLHLLLSTFLWMPSYYAKLWQVDTPSLVPLVMGASLDKFGFMKPGAATNCLPTNITLLPGTGGMAYYPPATSNGPTCSIASPGTNASAPAVALASSTFISVRSRLNWIGELSMFLGIAAGVAMGLTGMTSLPCITPRLNWREWRLMQSKLGWASLVLSTVHVVLLGAPAWPQWRTEWPALIPTITLMSTVPAMLLLVLKFVLEVPPCSLLLRKVRRGHWAPSMLSMGDIPDYAVCKHE